MIKYVVHWLYSYMYSLTLRIRSWTSSQIATKPAITTLAKDANKDIIMFMLINDMSGATNLKLITVIPNANPSTVPSV